MSFRIEPYAELLPGYRLIERLGGGGFGEVWKAEAPGGLYKAVKIIHGSLQADTSDETYHAQQELLALKRVQAIRHPYLLSLERYDIVQGRLLIVTELADCSLWDRFEEYRHRGAVGIPRSELLRYLEEAAEVLDTMNIEHQLQHLDIKPQNLFLVHNHVKVADFGLVKDLEAVSQTAVAFGMTAVYAAPETFDGGVSRYCDQYSLAIVYSELLTGQRPFMGENMKDLVVQHLEAVPDLSALPEMDRPAVARALSKRPEDRFPTCLQFIRALLQVGRSDHGRHPSLDGYRMSMDTPAPAAGRTPTPSSRTRRDTPPANLVFRESDSGLLSEFRLPPVETGNGVLMPAIIIGLGQTGLEVLREFHLRMNERYGNLSRLPNLKLLYVDTDPETIEQARQAHHGVALDENEILEARLNRASHYLQMRRNGRSVIEGWFEPQMLYRIRRTPLTMGVRSLGRLSFCDHYRAFVSRVLSLVQDATSAQALAEATQNTHLELRTNRPRIYIIANLGGGTGGGMFLDAAYAIRQQLQRVGFEEPEIIGMLVLPAEDRTAQRQRTLSNTHAALRELYHFSLADTEFTANYDTIDGAVCESRSPFHCSVLFPSLPVAEHAAMLGTVGRRSRQITGQAVLPTATLDPTAEVTATVANYLRRDLTSMLGRRADVLREKLLDERHEGPILRVCHTAGYSWPHEKVISLATRFLSHALVRRWIAEENPPEPTLLRGWIAEQWTALQLAPEAMVARFQQAAEKILDESPEALFRSAGEPFRPTRRWHAKPVDAQQLKDTVDLLRQLVGLAEGIGRSGQTGRLEQLLTRTSEELAASLEEDLAQKVTNLLEHPQFRLVGAEQASLHLHNMIEQVVIHYEPLAQELSRKSLDAYAAIQTVLANLPQTKGSAAELADNLLRFPDYRWQSLVLREACRIYNWLRADLNDRAREFEFCRRRLKDLLRSLEQMASDLTLLPGELLPSGCASLEQAAYSFIRQLRDQDWQILEQRLSKKIEQDYGSLFAAFSNSDNLLDQFRDLLLSETRSFLDQRMQDVDIVEMFFARYAQQDQAVAMIQRAYHNATPPLTPYAPGKAEEVCILGLPAGEQGEPFQFLVHRALGYVDIHPVAHPDEILFYREYFQFPLESVPQMGRMAQEAYGEVIGMDRFSPHTRIDILDWRPLPPSSSLPS